MNDKNEIILPKIVNMGVFDANHVYGNKKATPNRKVSLFEIELPIEDGGFSYIDNEEYPIRKDCIICIKPGQVRHTVLPFKCYYVHLLLNEGALIDYVLNSPNVFKILQTSKYIKLFTSMIEAYCSPFKGSKIFIQSRILELIYRIHTDSQRRSRQNMLTIKMDNDIIPQALSFLDSNFKSKITLEDVAKYVNLSPIYFHKVFCAAVGQTPHQYLLEKRLQTAKDLLLFSNMSFTEISFECGFTSQSYFNYVFKKEVGLTPKQYKKNAYDNYPKF